MLKREKNICLCMGLLLMLGATARATDRNWTGGGADNLWTTSGNWDAVPVAGDNAIIDITANNPLINMDVAAVYDNIYIGESNPDGVVLTVQSGGHLRQANVAIFVAHQFGSTGTLDMSGGAIDGRDLVVGKRGSAVVNMTGGAMSMYNNIIMGDVDGHGVSEITFSGGTVDVSNWTGVGRQSGGMNTLNVTGTGYLETGHLSVGLDDGDGTLNISGNGHVKLDAASSRLRVGEIGNGSTGTINLDGGILEVDSYIALGYSTGASGSMNLTAGDVSVNAFVVGLNGGGEFNMTGGSVTLDSHVRVGEGAGVGSWTMSGGLVVATNYISVGWGLSSGKLNLLDMTGGEIETGDLHVGRYSSGRINLSGGTIKVNVYGSGSYTNGLRFDTDGGNGLLNLSGGILQWMNGNYTNEVDALVLSGDIVAYDGVGAVDVTYDAGTGITTIEGTSSLYEQWAEGYGLSGADAEKDADLDGDGFNNLCEYGLGGNPLSSADQGIAPIYGPSTDAGSSMTYVYPKLSAGNRGISYRLELTDNLVTGGWVNTGYIIAGVDAVDSEFNAISNRIPTDGADEQFVRLVLEDLGAGTGLMIANFEAGTYDEGWTTTGTAFGTGPATGALGGQRKVTGFEGLGLVNSFLGGDFPVGTLTSPEFVVQRGYINFLIGGGNIEGETCVNLWVGGVMVRTQTGFAEEQLRWVYWDVSDLIGQNATIEIVDAATGSWGHINIDNIVQSDSRSWFEVELAVQVEKRYLNIPVDNSERRDWVLVHVDGAETNDYYFELQLADPGEADFWVYMDLSRYDGQEVVLKTRRDITQDINGLAQCYQSDEPRDAATFYTEEKRPQFHFSSQRGWLNDVNGVFFYDGQYHLFYQHNPYAWRWGNMHWGHAVSTDLVHWAEQGDEIFSDELGTIFSGTAVVDEMNTSGFQNGSDLPIVALYTGAGGWAPEKVTNTQSIAYSTDGAATFGKYAGNPVIDPIEGGTRDPKVLWHEATEKWVMVLYLEGDTFGFFTSTDLKEWQKTSEIVFPEDGDLDCPDLFSLALDGDTNTVKWLLWGGHGTYFVGDFDGATFTPDNPLSLPLSYAGAGGGPDGSAGYAAQTYNNIPQSDGRCIQMAWMHGWGTTLFEGMPFNQQLTFPVELKLNSTTQGPRISAWPVSEIESLYTTLDSFSEQIITPASANLLDGLGNDMKDIYAEFELANNAATFGFRIRGAEFVYNAATQQIEIGGQTIDLEPVDGKINMRVLVDRMSVEFFAGDGLVCMQNYLAPPETNSVLEIFTQDDSVILKMLEVNGLESVWE